VLYVNFIAILLEAEPQSSAQKPLKHCRRLPRKTQMTKKPFIKTRTQQHQTDWSVAGSTSNVNIK
jgi:hypothetical protein